MFKSRSNKILVIKTDSLAGFVAAEPVFESIRQAHPDSVISLLTTKELERLARAAPYFDQVAALPDMGDRIARQSLITQIRRSKFGTIYDLCNGDAARRIQNGLGLNMFGPKWHSVQATRSPFMRQNGVAIPDKEKFYNTAGIERSERKPDFSWALEARKDSANMQPSWYGLSGSYGLLLVNGDRDQRWSADRYGALANLMAEAGVTPVLIGERDLHDFGDDISMIAPSLVDLTGKSDHLQLAALAQNANFFVSDNAEEIYLALSMACDGVLISDDDEPTIKNSGCHVVYIRPDHNPNAVDAEQVWQTLLNMGLAPRYNSAREDRPDQEIPSHPHFDSNPNPEPDPKPKLEPNPKPNPEPNSELSPDPNSGVRYFNSLSLNPKS